MCSRRACAFSRRVGYFCRLREKKGFTQTQLAERLCVSSKAVSKWETGKGLPDIILIEPLAAALDVSVMELYAEGNTECRMQLCGRGYLYIYCNKHGLMKKRI